jgi:hypothetical protein
MGGNFEMKLFYSRRLWFFILFSLVAVFSILLFNYRQTLINNWLDTLKYTFGIVGLIATIYNHWKKFNLLVTRIKIILFNSSSKWNVQSVIEGNFDESIQKKVRNKLIEFNNSSRINILNDKLFSINIDGLHFTFDYVDVYTDDFSDTNGKLVCRVDDFYCAYDQSIDIFQKKLVPIFRSIEKETSSLNNIYTFKIHFEGRNPFLSLIAKNIDSNKVHDLWYRYSHENNDIKRDVKVTKNVLECTTNDITDLQYSSTNFISLVGD